MAIVVPVTKEVMSEEIARGIMCAHEEEKKQHSAFVKDHLESQTVLFHEPIKLDNIFLPSNGHRKYIEASMSTT